MNRIGAGVIGGLVAGVAFGIMMQMMPTPTPDGMSVPMMAMVAKIIGSDSIAIGWVYHLFNSAVIGAIFGWLLGRKVSNYKNGLGLGALYGVGWWILGGLILMPLLLGMPAFAQFRMPGMAPVAWGSMMGHIIYGLILGVTYFRLARRRQIGVAGEIESAPRRFVLAKRFPHQQHGVPFLSQIQFCSNPGASRQRRPPEHG